MTDTSPDETSRLTQQEALVAIMVATSASDDTVRTSELLTIQRIVQSLPVFAGFDHSAIRPVSELVFRLFAEEDGLDAFFSVVKEALPRRLNETAYALACDIAASDGRLGQQELELLEEIREELEVSKLHAAAIEQGARARHLGL
ncbi:tellurite resistance TerB family protein [Roseicyclus sp. F158]|uniref:Tellurite resistance TerB family protein n=1 Tax=Tropicimonas omnivorans TaxID=3075590 RepID=A0ABU3DEA3_9RHOB|nr:tellurite resistance TerB family protein [Roseicyclus sp. F158]MDT0682039.1 tellurite resistance TerB family protein [Roseicyclus sp. F158]